VANEYDIGAEGDEGTGEYEIAGDAETGAAPRQLPPGVSRGGGPKKKYTQTMPLTSQLLLGTGATARMQAQPQRPMRCERLFLSSPTGNGLANFVVTSIQVGADLQFVNDGDVPADVYAFNSVGGSIRAATANPGIVVTVTIRNISGGPASLYGAFVGTSLE
jgi:hypothetical protein